MKKLLNSEESKVLAYQAITDLAALVKATLGPGGNPIILEQQGQNPDGSPKTPLITKDGVTVAQHISFRNPAMNTIAQAIIQVANSTVHQAGDGTTTAIVLAEALFKAGFAHIKRGANGIQLYDALKAAKDAVIAKLDEIRIPIKEEDLFYVANISANGDEEVAKVVSDAIKMVGEDGHVDIEQGFARETTLELVEGAMYKQGWRRFGPLGSLMVTDKVKNVAEYDRPAVLLYAGDIKTVDELMGVLKTIMGTNDDGSFKNIIPIVIVAYDFGDEVKNAVIAGKVQAKLPLAAIKAPFDGSPNARTQMLEDLAVLLGGQVLARGILDLKDLKDEHLGCADVVRVGEEETVFVRGHGNEAEILQRVDDLKKQLAGISMEFDRENLRRRIGKLTGGIAIIRAGGNSELEIKEKRDRIEDALCAAKVAISEGVVAGGGLTLYQIAQSLTSTGGLVEDTALQIMKEALQAPIKQIITNIGESPDRILTRLELPENAGKGYDARNQKFVNLIEAGILDPVKVTKSALENAVSIVGLLLTTGGAIVSDIESKDGLPNPLAGMFQ